MVFFRPDYTILDESIYENPLRMPVGNLVSKKLGYSERRQKPETFHRFH
jgi:hypothetical protein